jgi:hypothetical protein
LAREEGVDGRIELIATFQELEFKEEDIAKKGAAKFLDERPCCSRGTTWCKSVLVTGK